MSHLKNLTLYTASLNSYKRINIQLLAGLNTYLDDESTRKSHHFSGRYENIYIGNDKIPVLAEVIQQAIENAAMILHRPAKELKAGLWFNVMNPGDKTTKHQHDDDDELLSAVYYVRVADNSGKLCLGKGPVLTQVTPQEGLFVFFSPDMPHEVTENLSEQCRVSLGINIGPVDPSD